MALRKGALSRGGQARTSFGVDALTNIHSNFTDARKTGAALRRKRDLAAGVHLLIPLSKHNEPSFAVVSRAEKLIITNTQNEQTDPKLYLA